MRLSVGSDRITEVPDGGFAIKIASENLKTLPADFRRVRHLW
ncbi:MAG: hypothetical protein OXF79_01435 [Chloroflexi bacterium]|nr:hypothetical protein [Chloroflexota bacterium]